MIGHTLDFDSVLHSLLESLPPLSRDEQQLGRALYQALAAGEPVRRERLAEILDVPTRQVVELLDGDGLRCLTYYNEQRSVIGFGGLAVVPMHHRFVVDGRTLYAWCAWDTLFLPELLQVRASVQSACPETGETICLTVGTDGIEANSHADVRVSFPLLDAEIFRGAAEQTMTRFCHLVFFFASAQAGTAWTSKHEGTCSLTLAQAFELGKRKNAAQFSTVVQGTSRR